MSVIPADRVRAPSLPARPVRDWSLGAAVRRPGTWLWLLALVAVAPQPWHQLHVRVDVMIDMHVYRDAGLSLLHHDGVYTHYTLTRFSVLPFTYPPFAAVIALPLALVPFTLVAALWDAAVYLVLLGCLQVFLAPWRARLRGQGTRLEVALLPAAFALCSWLVPIRQQVHYGQVGVFLMGLVVLDLLTPRTGRWQGWLTGVATAIKLTPGVFIIGLWLAGRRRAAIVAACTTAIISGVTAVVLPGTSRAYWTGALFASDRLGDNADPANQSLRGIVLRTPLAHLGATAVFLGCALLVAAAGFALSTRAWRRGDDLQAVMVVGMLSALLSPVAWVHHYVWVVPLLVVLLRDRHRLTALSILVIWWLDWIGAGLDADHFDIAHAHLLSVALEAVPGASIVVVLGALFVRRSPRSGAGPAPVSAAG